MKEKAYILSFDHNAVDPEALHQTILYYSGTINWWHFLGFTYLLTSTRSATEIQAYFHAQWPELRFLVTSVTDNANDIDGWLPQDAWKWMVERGILEMSKANSSKIPKTVKKKKS